MPSEERCPNPLRQGKAYSMSAYPNPCSVTFPHLHFPLPARSLFHSQPAGWHWHTLPHRIPPQLSDICVLLYSRSSLPLRAFTPATSVPRPLSICHLQKDRPYFLRDAVYGSLRPHPVHFRWYTAWQANRRNAPPQPHPPAVPIAKSGMCPPGSDGRTFLSPCWSYPLR